MTRHSSLLKSSANYAGAVLLAFTAFTNAPATVAPKTGYSVAVLPFQISHKQFQGSGEDLQNLITAHLSGENQLMLVERAEIDKALSEVELGKSGTVDPVSAATVGYMTGAQILVTGRVFPVQKELVIVSKVIGVETSRVYGQTVSMPLRGSLVTASVDLSGKIAAAIQDRGHTLVATKGEDNDVVERLRTLVEGRELPSVSVSIPETSITENTLDPAAETEIGHLLQRLGFEIIDPLASNEAADIEITGEAFSEFGLRKGNLVSSKGRVEVKAISRTNGKVLLVDRDTAVAVDLSPEMAGKAALAKSATRLTERLVAAIVKSEPR
jgi:hypothetical protein